MRTRPPFGLMLALAGWAVCGSARASGPLATDESQTLRLTLPPGFRASDETDYALSLVGFAGSGVLALAFRPNERAHWDQSVLFDGAVRDAFRGSTRATRSAYNLASNLTVYSSIGWVAFDALGVAWASAHSPNVARELVWMDAEAYALTELVTTVTKRLALRRRPYVAACSTDPNYVGDCGTTEQNISFFSGHSALSATSAGLVCVQHQSLQLYGGAGDALACAGALGVMTATGVLRIASDNHWASDVLVGYLVGFASGYGLPLLLHFQGAARTPEPRRSVMHVRLMPLSDGSRTSLFAIGQF